MRRSRRVAQIFNLLYRRFATCRQGFAFGVAAESNSAIRRTGNLRYLVGLFALLAFSPSGSLFAQSEATNATTVRFLAVDIYVDSKGKPLAAYQLEFSVTNGNAKIVGIEGGEHQAFREPPHYDPKAIQKELVIIAAFSTEPADKLPNGKRRVATIHLQLAQNANPQFAINLQVAANARGDLIQAEADIQFRRIK